MKCMAMMFMKRYLIINALFFTFYKENVSDFGNIVLQNPEDCQTGPCPYRAIVKKYRSLEGKGFSSPG